jgi:DNA primase
LLPDVEKIWVSNPDVNSSNLEILTEGVFDALSTGFKNSGAMLSASVSEEFLNKLNPDCIIALDNDSTGIQKTLKYAEKGFKVFIWPREDYKDFNDMLRDFSDKEINTMIKVGAKRGIEAVVELKMKEV